MKDRLESWLLRIADALAIAFFAYLVVLIFGLARIEPMNYDSAWNCGFFKNFAWGNGFEYSFCGGKLFPPHMSTGAPVGLPVAFGIWLFGNGFSVPHVVMATVNLILLAVALILPIRCGIVDRRFGGLHALAWLLFYFLFPCSDRAPQWFYAVMGEMPTFLLLYIGAVVLFSGIGNDRISRWRTFLGGALMGSAVLAKDIGLFPLVAIFGGWLWLRLRCLPFRGIRELLADVAVLIAGLLTVPFLWQLFIFAYFGFSPAAFIDNKRDYIVNIQQFHHAEAQGGSVVGRMLSRLDYYFTVDGLLWSVFMAVLPLALAIRFLFVKSYDKKYFAWVLFFAGYAVYCYWVLFEMQSYSRRLLLGHMFFLAGAAAMLFQRESKWLKIALVVLIAINPQIRNAWSELTTFSRPDLVRARVEAEAAARFCIRHPESKFVSFGSWCPHLANYLHPEKDCVTSGDYDGTRMKDTYAIVEARYLQFYRDRFPPYARLVDPDTRFWQVYDLSAPPEQRRPVERGDVNGDGLTEVILRRDGNLRDVQVRTLNGEVCQDGNSAARARIIADGADFWDGYRESCTDQDLDEGTLYLCGGDGVNWRVPGTFSDVWRLVSAGDFSGDGIDEFLFYCSQLGRHYLVDVSGRYTDVGYRRSALACGPIADGKETVFFATKDAGVIETLEGTRIRIPSPWKVVAAGRYDRDAGYPQLLLVDSATCKVGLLIGADATNVRTLGWTVPSGWSVFGRTRSTGR